MDLSDVLMQMEEQRKDQNVERRLDMESLEKSISDVQCEFRQKKREALKCCGNLTRKKLVCEEWKRKKEDLAEKIREMRKQFKQNVKEEKKQFNEFCSQKIDSVIRSLPSDFFQPSFNSQQKDMTELHMTEELLPFFRYLQKNPKKQLLPALSPAAQECLLHIAKSVCPIHRSAASVRTLDGFRSLLQPETTLKLVAQYCPCHQKEIPSWLTLACVSQVNRLKEKIVKTKFTRRLIRVVPSKKKSQTKLETLQRWLKSAAFLAEFNSAKLYLQGTCNILSIYTAKLHSLQEETVDSLVKTLRRLLFVVLNQNALFLMLKTLRKKMFCKIIKLTLPNELKLGMFIGKEGSNLKEMQDNTGVTISVLNAAKHTGNCVEISLKAFSNRKCEAAQTTLRELVKRITTRQKNFISKKRQHSKVYFRRCTRICFCNGSDSACGEMPYNLRKEDVRNKHIRKKSTRTWNKKKQATKQPEKVKQKERVDSKQLIEELQHEEILDKFCHFQNLDFDLET